MSITPENRDPSDGIAPTRYRDAFLVADELSVHGSDCVCPTCAARLPGLLAELAAAIRKDTAD
ncbi:hypothetical protein [Actinomycetospora flava]|uniref:Uncharacterized protein n=1 Tax=Actinomycetospora flava TaxID=3129232 RepID=A0ABU8LZZ3_9PSEU